MKKKILTKVLCIVLVCVMLATCMGAYGGEVDKNTVTINTDVIDDNLTKTTIIKGRRGAQTFRTNSLEEDLIEKYKFDEELFYSASEVIVQI